MTLKVLREGRAWLLARATEFIGSQSQHKRILYLLLFYVGAVTILLGLYYIGNIDSCSGIREQRWFERCTGERYELLIYLSYFTSILIVSVYYVQKLWRRPPNKPINLGSLRPHYSQQFCTVF